MRFSIIIPVYNTEKYLRKCLDSLIRQQGNDFEIILVDDGSTDGSAAICDEYSAKYSFVTVHHKENSGVIEARYTGMKFAKGEYIGFLDSDDWVKENYLVTIEKVANEYCPDIICYESEKVTSKNIFPMTVPFSGYYGKEKIKNEVYPVMLYYPQKKFHTFGIIPAMWSKFFKMELLKKIAPIDKRIFWGEDGLLTYEGFLQAQSAFFINQSLYCWRYREGSACHSYQNKMYDNIQILCNSFITMADEYPEIRVSLDYYFVFIYLMLMLNEVKAKSGSVKQIATICEDERLKTALKRIDRRKVNLAYRVLFYMIEHRHVVMIISGCKLVLWLKERKEHLER